MTATCAILADDVEDLVGPRLRDWLSPYSAKWLARTFNASVSTAEKWRTGCLPATKHIAQMLSFWGQGFVDQVLAPVVADPTSLEDRAARIEQDMTALRKEIADAERSGGVGSGRADVGGERAGSAGAAGGQGRAAAQRTALAAAGRNVGGAVVGLALGLSVAQSGGLLTVGGGDDEPIQRVQQRTVRGAPRKAPGRACNGGRDLEV